MHSRLEDWGDMLLIHKEAI